jgi:hypothetical protein
MRSMTNIGGNRANVHRQQLTLILHYTVHRIYYIVNKTIIQSCDCVWCTEHTSNRRQIAEFNKNAKILGFVPAAAEKSSTEVLELV